MELKIWIICHCRSGTHYAAHLFQRAGWKVGAEKVDVDGISAWLWAVPAAKTVVNQAIADPCGNLPRPSVVLHTIRNPVECVPSIASLGFVQDTEAWRRHYVFIPTHADPIVRAIWSYLNWNLLCRAQCTLTTRTEELEAAVTQITGENVTRVPGEFNAREHPTFTEWEILERIGDDAMTLEAWERSKRLWEDTEGCEPPPEWGEAR